MICASNGELSLILSRKIGVKNVLFAGISMLLVAVANAANEWQITNNYIENVSTYISASGSNFIIEIKLKNQITTGCSISDQQNLVRWWGESVGPHDSSLLAAAMAALAQGAKVDIRTNASSCNSSHGRPLTGVRIHSN